MRNDSRNLLAKLDRVDFQYRDFNRADASQDDGRYAWPLLDLVYQATVGERLAVQRAALAAAAPPPPPVYAVVPESQLFNHYAPVAPIPPEVVRAPATTATQDLSSLLKSYSGRR